MTCRKIRFRTELEAKIALPRSQFKQSSKREECRVYRCPNCHGWHMTSRGRRRKP